MLIRRLTAIFLIMALMTINLPAMAETPPYRITVDLTNNIVTIFSTADDSIVRQMICSSGTPQDPTIQGTFTMIKQKRKVERKEWYVFADGYGKWGSRITGNYLFHSYLFVREDDDAVYWPSYAAMGTDASHGCIRLYIDDAKWIAKNCFPGTKVKIYESGVQYGYLKELLYQQSFSIDNGISYAEFAKTAANDTELGYNSKGDEVSLLQSKLITLGLYSGERDGYYGEDLLKTVAAIQTALDLPVTGIADETFLAIISGDDPPVSTLATLREGMSWPSVKVLQALLKSLGLYDGEIDGNFESTTREGVILFQRLTDQEETGIVTPELINEMKRKITLLNTKYGEGQYAVTFEEDNATYATITCKSVLNVREKKSTSSKSLAKIEPGAVVTVLKSGDKWTGISYNDIMGYVMTEYLDINATDTLMPVYGKADATHPALEEVRSGLNVIATKDVKYAAVKSGTILSVWESSSTGSKLNFNLSPKTVVRVISASNSWAFITYGGKHGYAKLSQLQTGTVTELSPETKEVEAPDGDDADNVEYAYVTNEEGTTLYRQASASGDVVDEIGAGERAEVIFASTSWTQVRVGEKTGYVSNEDVFIGTNDGIDEYLTELAASRAVYGVVSTGSDARLNMRTDGTEEAAVARTLENGTVVKVVNDDGVWSQIELDQKTGYVMSKYVLQIDENQEPFDPVAAGYDDELNDALTDETIDETSDDDTGGN